MYQPSPVVLCMPISLISIRITSLYESQPVHVAFACKPAPFGAELQVSIGPRPHLSSCACMICTRMTSLYGFQPLSVFFSIHNSDFRTSLTSLYGSQTSSVVLSTHNNVLSTRIKRLCGFQPSSVVFACKTATLGPDLQVCMCPRPHLCF